MFLKEALSKLGKQLKTVGADLTVLVGNAAGVLDKLNSQSIQPYYHLPSHIFNGLTILG